MNSYPLTLDFMKKVWSSILSFLLFCAGSVMAQEHMDGIFVGLAYAPDAETQFGEARLIIKDKYLEIVYATGKQIETIELGTMEENLFSLSNSQKEAYENPKSSMEVIEGFAPEGKEYPVVLFGAEKNANRLANHGFATVLLRENFPPIQFQRVQNTSEAKDWADQKAHYYERGKSKEWIFPRLLFQGRAEPPFKIKRDPCVSHLKDLEE